MTQNLLLRIGHKLTIFPTAESEGEEDDQEYDEHEGQHSTSFRPVGR